jgi:protein-L-isoaspartate O-methyltransferase
VPDWKTRAADMAAAVTPGVSRWRQPLASVPRHEYVPSWWARRGDGWVNHGGKQNPDRWVDAAYRDVSLVTRVGTMHADAAAPGTTLDDGRPTSSSTHPGLLIQMYRHGQLVDGMDVLDVGTGSGYGTALLCTRLGDRHVTSVDVDPYLVKAARERLEANGLTPTLEVCDATRIVPGTYDRIVATVAVSPIPPAWIEALRPGGRIVTVLDGTTAILTANRQPDGTLLGRIERDWAGFMPARHSDTYPPEVSKRRLDLMLESSGDQSARAGVFPLTDLDDAWELYSNLAVQHQGIQTRWVRRGTYAISLIWDREGSWARAEGSIGQLPTVHVSGPIDLWRSLDGLKKRWLIEGRLPLYGANATVGLDGTIRLSRGHWGAIVKA